MTIGGRIRLRRKELGLTQTELAQRMGYTSRTSICTVETDKEDLTTTRVKKFAEALETTPSYLMGWTDNIDHNIKVDENSETVIENNKEALELFDRYSKADPEVREMIEYLLKKNKED